MKAGHFFVGSSIIHNEEFAILLKRADIVIKPVRPGKENHYLRIIRTINPLRVSFKKKATST